MKNPPKRWLRLTSPYMNGEDVRRLQVAINDRRAARGLAPIVVDGEYGRKTAQAVRSTLWHLGCPADKLGAGGTTTHQARIRSPRRRPPTWLVIARDRKKWLDKQGAGRRAFVAALRTFIGKVEQPRDMNRGPWLDPLLKAVGWLPPGDRKGPPYCGIALIALLRRVGFAAPASWAYTPALLADARAERNGARVVPMSDRQAGDLFVIKIPGVSNDPCDHVGAVEDYDSSIEFNTSPGRGGSQNNGGGCYRRNWGDRAPMVVAVIRLDWAS